MVILFGDEQSKIVEFFSSIEMEGEQATKIQVTKSTIVTRCVIELTGPEIRCRMFDDLTREQVYIDVSMEVDLHDNLEEKIAFIDISKIRKLVSSFPKGSTVVFEKHGEDIFVRNHDSSVSIPIQSMSPEMVVSYIPEKSNAMDLESENPCLREGIDFDLKFENVNLSKLRVMKKINSLMKSPRIGVKVDGTDLVFISRKIRSEARPNKFISTHDGCFMSVDGEWVEGSASTNEGTYPMGIPPAIESLDIADVYIRGDKDLKAIMFSGSRNGVTKRVIAGPEEG